MVFHGFGPACFIGGWLLSAYINFVAYVSFMQLTGRFQFWSLPALAIAESQRLYYCACLPCLALAVHRNNSELQRGEKV